MDLEFDGEVVVWRGPAPHHFVAVPAEECDDLRDASAFVSYGWGMVPVTVHLGATVWTTSLWPKDGGYLVPLKAAARRAEGVGPGDVVRLRLTVAV